MGRQAKIFFGSSDWRVSQGPEKQVQAQKVYIPKMRGKKGANFLIRPTGPLSFLKASTNLAKMGNSSSPSILSSFVDYDIFGLGNKSFL
jgi:hypothetical protein